MFPPIIDYARLDQAIEAAEQMLVPYNENLVHLNNEIVRVQQEIVAATAIVQLIARADTRREVLGDCHPYSEIYADVIGNRDGLDQHRQFLNTLEFRQKSYGGLLVATKKAIEMLENDIADLKTVAKTRFRCRWEYLSVPSNGWSFFIFRYSPRPFRVQPTFFQTQYSF